MKFFADTASLEEISYCFSRGVNDGITTNPKIMEVTGDLSLGFLGACRAILEKYSDVPVSLETDLDGVDIQALTPIDPKIIRNRLLRQAYDLSKLGRNVVVKIPVCAGGILATEELSRQGIKTNVTACMTPYQALEAAEAGATYVSLFSNRMLDSHLLALSGNALEEILTNPGWKQLVSSARKDYLEEAWNLTLGQISYVAERLETSSASLIVGSIRSSDDIYRIASSEPQIITIPTKIVEGLNNVPQIKQTKRLPFDYARVNTGNSLLHPMTTYTLDEFEKAADTYRK